MTSRLDSWLDDALPDREVGARRARVLRKRGEDVRFWFFTMRGKARYRWIAAVPRWPKAHRPDSSARLALPAMWEALAAERAAWSAAFQPQCDALRAEILAAFESATDEPMGRPWHSGMTFAEAREGVAKVVASWLAPEQPQRVDPLPPDSPERASVVTVDTLPPGFVVEKYAVEAKAGGCIDVTLWGTMGAPR